MRAQSARTLAAAVLALPLAAACGGEAETRTDAPSAARVVVSDRYVVRKSARGFEATLAALYEALDRRDLTVFAVIDHAAAAEGAGASLPPTTVVIFGDPEAGTPLMAAAPVMGAELPLRALIYERDGEAFVAMTGMANLARTYQLRDRMDVVDAVERTLAEIAGEVAGP